MKKKIGFAFAIIFTLSLNSQEINEEFLESLPDDIRADILEKNAQQENSANQNYSAYLNSSKLNQPQEDLDDEEELLFGSDFFNTFQTTFMPINEPNPDSGYTLDTGDVLSIQLVGQKDEIDDYIINGDGAINFPDIGKITLAGLTLSQASSLIELRINNAFIGTQAIISLSEIRDVNVLVTGNSKNPGIYTLTGNSNILHAISVSGGISKFGSYREINLIRDNEIIESLDVYDLLINGQYNLKKRLRSGDVVFVEARQNVVSIEGAVFRPSKYEIKKGQNLDSVIKYANGVKRTADYSNVSLERILDGSLKSIPIVNVSQFSSILALDGDIIYIREYPYREAKISGAVLKPGTYTMAPGQTLVDLIDVAGGFTDNAYIFGAVYQNEEAKKINQIASEILYQEFLTNILAITEQSIGQSIDLTTLVGLTEETRNSEPNGRVVVDLNNEELSNLYPVNESDELFIPEKSNVVYVYGEISSEGAVMFSQGKDAEFFVARSGGYKKYADKESIYILHPNGESQFYSYKRNIFEGSPRNGIEIYPGSIIFVPRELDESTPRRLATQAYISIVSNLGVALASLVAIQNNN